MSSHRPGASNNTPEFSFSSAAYVHRWAVPREAGGGPAPGSSHLGRLLPLGLVAHLPWLVAPSFSAPSLWAFLLVVSVLSASASAPKKYL